MSGCIADGLSVRQAAQRTAVAGTIGNDFELRLDIAPQALFEQAQQERFILDLDAVAEAENAADLEAILVLFQAEQFEIVREKIFGLEKAAQD